MFIRLTPLNNPTATTKPGSIYINVDDIAKVEEIRSRPNTSEIELQLKITMKDGRREDMNDQAYSKATIKSFLDHLDKHCLNPKDAEPEAKPEKPVEKKVA